jgi:hypothetical protein
MKRLFSNLLSHLVTSRCLFSRQRVHPKSGPALRSGPPCRPQLELLEDRIAPTILFGSTAGKTLVSGSGPVIAHAHVDLIFWGTGWNSGSGPALRTNMQTAVDSILAGPYMSGLSQHRGIGNAIRTRSDPITTSSPGATFTDDQVNTMVGTNIGNHTLPDPSTDSQLLYMVVPQPGSLTGTSLNGEHNFGTAGSTRFHYGWTLDNGALDTLTNLFSHELAEAVTDPEGTAITVSPADAGTSGWFEIGDGAAQNYVYRLNGYLVQSYFSQATASYDVYTGQAQNFVVTGDGNRVVTVNGGQLTNPNDVITLDRSAANGVRVTLNGEVAQFEPDTRITDVFVNTQNGNDIVNIEATMAGLPTTLNLGNGDDTANISPFARNLDNIRGSVDIHGGAGFDILNVYDQASAGNQTYTLTSSTITRTGSNLITYGNPYIDSVNIFGGNGGNRYVISDTYVFSSTTLNTGSGTEDVVNVQRTTGPLTVNVQGNGDAVNVGSAAQTLDTIQGPLTVNGASTNGFYYLDLLDMGTLSAKTYTLTANSIARAGAAAISYRNTPRLTLYGARGGNTINVQGSVALAGNVVMDLLPGIGSNVVNFGSAANTLDLLHGSVAVENQGRTRININDQGAGAAQTYRLTSRTIDRSGAAQITYFGISDLVVSGGSGGNTINVLGTLAATPVTINAGAGNDTINVGSTANKLDTIQGPVTLNGAGGSGQLNINDQGTGNFQNYKITAQTVSSDFSQPTFATISYSAVQNLTPNEANGPSANYTNVLGTPAGTSSTFRTGFRVGVITFSLPGIAGPVMLDPQTGGDTAYLYDGSAAGDGRAYTISNTGVTSSDGFSLAYPVNAVLSFGVFASNTFSETINVQSVSATMDWFIAGGTGDDTFNVGAPGNTNIRGRVTLDGGGGSGTLAGGNLGNLFALTSRDAGTLSNSAYGSDIGFSQMGSLAGSSGATFRFADVATLSGTIAPEVGALNMLDYSAYASSSVVVDLQTGLATAVAGGIANIQAVIGASGGGAQGLYNLLIGNGGNTLIGGADRRNLLVAGASPSNLIGGNQDDLLIAGTTAYDTDPALTAWLQLAAYWVGTDDFPTRAANLTSGNGVPLLDASVVLGNGGGNNLVGYGELALIYSDGLDNVSGFDPGSQVVPINP